MDITKSGQKKSVTIWPEKLYALDEVDGLLEKRQDTLGREIEKENQTADKQKRLDKRNVANLVKKSNRILVSISAVFPFEFFPNSINVEEGRITIIKRHLLSSAVHSIDIKNISNIFINTTIFFSQLVIVSKTFEENEIRIRYLRNSEAVFLRRIIEGLRVFEYNQIDTSHYSKKELIAKLEELSTTEIVT